MKRMSHAEAEIAVHKSHCFSDIMNEDYGCKYGPDNECPSNQNLDDLISGLSLFEKQVLRDLTEISYDWFQGYSAIDFRGHDKKEVKQVVDKLKVMGLIEFTNGLMYEDEYRTAGSGWRVVRKPSVVQYFEENETFDSLYEKATRELSHYRRDEGYRQVPDILVKLKEAHEREMVNKFR